MFGLAGGLWAEDAATSTHASGARGLIPARPLPPGRSPPSESPVPGCCGAARRHLRQARPPPCRGDPRRPRPRWAPRRPPTLGPSCRPTTRSPQGRGRRKGAGMGGAGAVYGGLSICDDPHGVLLYIIGNNWELCKIIGNHLKLSGSIENYWNSLKIIEIYWKMNVI